MEKINSPENQPVHQQGVVEQTTQTLPSDVMGTEFEGREPLAPASEEQINNILASADAMLGELPTVRYSEQNRFDSVDVDEAVMDGVSVKHIHGKDGDVTVIEPNLDDRSARIIINNLSKEVSIDGVPVDEPAATAVAGVIRQTRNMNNLPTKSEAEPETALEVEEAEHIDVNEELQTDNKPGLSPEQEERLIQQKRQVLGVVNEFLRTRNGDMALKQMASQLGVEPKDLQEKMKIGDIVITPDTMKALDQLRRDGAQPRSDVWATDPRSGSMLGGAARESQQLLSNVIKNMF